MTGIGGAPGVRPAPTPGAAPAPRARIIDRGYRRYTGPRTGVPGAMRTVWRQSVQRSLGLRRSPWAKVLPVATVLISYVPAIVFIGQVALIPEEEMAGLTLPTYGEYFPFIQAALVLFVSFVAPEVLCTDRRTGMLGIYLASPLNRDSYLTSKALSVISVLSLVTIGPTLLMLVAYVLQGVGPDGPGGVALTLLRIVGSGLLLAVLYTAVSMGVSALTDRKAFATAALLLLLLVSTLFIGVLIEAAELPQSWHAANLIVGPFNLVELVHGETASTPGVGLGATLAGVVAWTIGGFAVARISYQRQQVTR